MTSLRIDSTLTDANGKYLFTDLNPNDYMVEVEIPALFRSTDDTGSTISPNQADNDENGLGVSSSGTVSSGLINIVAGGGLPTDANWLESDHGQAINGMIDNTSNPKGYYTVDFGFYEVDCQFSICLPVNIVRN